MDTATRTRTLVISETDAILSRRDRLRAVIARLGGQCDWQVGSNGWVVTLHLPEERTFVAATLEAALAACVVWLAPDVPTGTTMHRADPAGR